MTDNKIFNRIPYEYFITSGSGSSELEQHAGSLHIALNQAKISDYNIQIYSSVLPAIAKEIETPRDIPFGSELYTIMSCIHGLRNDYLSCGVIFGDLYDNETKIGSLVCEVSGNYDEKTVLVPRLYDVIEDLHKRTYSQYRMKNFKHYTNSYIPDQKYGTCLVALCFYSFI